MKRIISALMIAVMLVCAFPLALTAAAETTYTPIALGVKTAVSLSRTNVEKDFTFTAPEDGEYAFYSEGDYDTRGFVFDTNGRLLTTEDDYYDTNFCVFFTLEKGEKVNLKATFYDFTRKGDFKVAVDNCETIRGLVVADDVINAYVGSWVYMDYTFDPVCSYGEPVEFIPADTSIVSVDDGDLYAKKLGTTTVKLKSWGGLEKTVTVNVIAPKKLELDKLLTVSGEDYYRFSFTPAQTGYYTVDANFVGEGYIGVDGGEQIPSGGGETYLFEKGREYMIYAENYIPELSFGVTVKKGTPAKNFDLMRESPLSYANYYMSYSLVPLDGYVADEVQWSIANTAIAEIDGYNDNISVNLLLKAKGTTKISATVNGVTTSADINVDTLGEVTLTKTYSKKDYDNQTVYAEFAVPKSGHYRVSATDSLGYDLDVGYFNEGMSNGYYDFYALEGECAVLCAYRPGYFEGAEEGTITLKVEELKKATSATPVNSVINAVVGQQVLLELKTQPEACYFEDIEEWSVKEGGNYHAYTDPSGLGFFYAYEPGTYDVVFKADGVSATIKVIVKDAETISLNQVKNCTRQPAAVDYVYKFKPEKSGNYTLDSIDNTVFGTIESFDFNTGGSGNTRSLIGGMEYYVIVEPHDDVTNFSFKVRNSEFATEIGTYRPIIFMNVGDTEWLPYYTVDGDSEEYVKEVNVSNKNVVYATGENVFAIGAGETKVEIVTEYGLKLEYTVVVFDPDKAKVTDASISKEELTLDIGKSETLTVTTTPKDAAKVYWYSEDESIATVDKNGRVTAITEGETWIGAVVDGIELYCHVETKAPAIVDSSKKFTDIKAGKWYTNAVNYAYSYGFIEGVSKTEFGLNQPVTRGMFITILARIAGVDTSSAANKAATTKFTDVKTGKFYTAAIKWASENGVVNGLTETTFGPNAAIERQQLCVMIVNFAKYMGVELEASKPAINFVDGAKFAKYAKSAIATCQMANIVSGYAVPGGFEFRPKNTATRGEAAQILYKFHKDFIMK